MDQKILIFCVLVFAAVIMAVWGVYNVLGNTKGQQAERVARRLRQAIGDAGSELAVSIIKERLLSRDPGVQRLLRRLPGTARLDRMLLQSGRDWNVARLLTVMAGCGALLALALAVLGMAWEVCLLAGLAACAAPLMELARAIGRRIIRIEYQLPEALDMMSRAMRAGHAFPTALKMVGEEMAAPLAVEFRAVFDEVNFGISMPAALMSMAQRVPSTDLRYFVVAVLIQRETGGNLTELLGSISAIIRDRLTLLGQVRVLSAEGRMSAWVLGSLPFGAGTMMYVVNPDFVNILFTDPAGRRMVAGAALLMLIGFFVIRKLVTIRV
ncbi:type II secretion system F family protein [Rugamonas sp.]|uniref:type II secretion system F family protein n=1 Tax=Rugamonas sp. TaxID=1926287 RepID=UPI0025E30F75|nr:type II secretion system F family protein [Rugamonas sp.]